MDRDRGRVTCRLRKRVAIRSMRCPTRHSTDTPVPATHREDSLLPTGTVTFLFTDIEGSTKLWEAHPEAMRVALARHDALLREAIVNANGYVFKTVGDAFCAAFASAPEAVAAALAVQLALHTEPWPEATPIRVRMALHTGAVESRDGDYFGPPVNRVARLSVHRLRRTDSAVAGHLRADSGRPARSRFVARPGRASPEGPGAAGAGLRASAPRPAATIFRPSSRCRRTRTICRSN